MALWFPLKMAFTFLDLVCSVYVVTNTTRKNYSFMISSKLGFHIFGHRGLTIVLWFPLKLASTFLDLVCSLYVVTNTIRVNCSFIISSKSGFIFFDLVCPIYVVANKTGINCKYMISSKRGFHISGPSMFRTYSYHRNWSLYVKYFL